MTRDTRDNRCIGTQLQCLHTLYGVKRFSSAQFSSAQLFHASRSRPALKPLPSAARRRRLSVRLRCSRGLTQVPSTPVANASDSLPGRGGYFSGSMRILTCETLFTPGIVSSHYSRRHRQTHGERERKNTDGPCPDPVNLKGRRWIPQPPAVPYEPAQIPKSAPMGLRAAHPRQPRSSTSRIQSRMQSRLQSRVVVSVTSTSRIQSRMRPRVVVSVTMSVIVSVINELDELSHSEGATRRGPQRLHKAISLRVRLDRSKYGRCG